MEWEEDVHPTILLRPLVTISTLLLGWKVYYIARENTSKMKQIITLGWVEMEVRKSTDSP